MNNSKLPCIDDEYVAVKSPFRNFGEDYTTYFILLQAIRITALLHDIGPPPYSHIAKFALEELKKQYKDSGDKERIDVFNKIMETNY